MRLFIYICFIFIFMSCKQTYIYESKKTKAKNYDEELSNKLREMFKIDQLAASPFDKNKFKSISNYRKFKDSVFRVNKSHLDTIFKKYNYPGIDLVGKKGETFFWVMVQHCDFDPTFQKKILKSLKEEVLKANAKPSHFALLTDRVRLNLKKKQIYGTQVSYNKYGQAFPRLLKDSINVDKRRNRVKLNPLKEYLNRMTINHFNMNKRNFIKKGILKPTLYNLK